VSKNTKRILECVR